MQIDNHKIYKLIVILIGLTLSIGCDKRKEIVFDIPQTEPKIVVNCLYRAYDYLIYGDQIGFTINLSKSRNFNDRDTIPYEFIDNAVIKITPFIIQEFPAYFPDSLNPYKDTVINKGNGEYFIPQLPWSGTEYKLQVFVPGFDTLTSVNKLPEVVPIQDAYFSGDGGVDEYGNSLSEITVKIKDPLIEPNFYKMNFNLYKEYKDSTTVSYGYTIIQSNDPVIQQYEEISDVYTKYFSDELFEGETYNLKLLVRDTDVDSFTIKVYLSSLSKDYFLYTKTKHLQSETMNNPYSQPVKVYTNIEGGFGIFAGYNDYAEDTVRRQ